MKREGAATELLKNNFDIEDTNMEDTKVKTIGILGAGQMGAGMAYLLSHYKGLSVKIWDRTPEVISIIQKTRESPHLPGIKLPEGVSVFSGLKEVIKDISLLVLAIPSFAVREMCEKLSRQTNSFPPFLMISKGLEKDSSKLPFQIAQEVLGQKDILHLTGIGYPKELDKERQVTEAIAATGSDLLKEFGDLFETHFIKFEKTTDLLGVQLAGALKNVMVIGIGMTTAREENSEAKKEFISNLVSLGVDEMISLGEMIGAEKETFYGPAGKGDLELSADPLSRNFRLGENLFHKGIEEVQRDLEKSQRTVEGFISASGAYRLAKENGLNLPLIEAVYQVIYQGEDPKKVTENLMSLVR